MPRYHSPLMQMLIISGVCFLGPGMFNALNGLGGAGQLDARTTSDANAALYASFAIFSIIGGGIVNMAGVRIPTAISCLTYALYTATYIHYNHTHNGLLTILAGVVLGVGGGILWTAQGVIIVSYPSENEKAKFISIFWVVFNVGGLLGGVLPFAINFSESGALTDSVYMVFVVLECVGACVALMLAPPSTIVRDDGSRATILQANTGLSEEATRVLRVFRNKWMLMLAPMSFASNFFYGYCFSVYNGAVFTPRTRGFNNLLYWTASIISSIALFALLDNARYARRVRGIYAVCVVFAASCAVWAGALIVQLRYSRGGEFTDYPGGLLDFLQTRAAGPIAVYFFMGVVDSWYQNMCYWIIGTLTCDARTTARYIGFHKGIQSVGAAVAWQLVARNVPFVAQLAVNWAVLVVSLPSMACVVMRIEDRALDDRLMYLSPRTNKSFVSHNSGFEMSATPKKPNRLTAAII
ncbi:hypothetical protein LPJ58_000192 [Coemansia sp. RSA 1591]|nr:hypothetical protein LPJ58_000192 [Coemansia sp. RSA 1591]KAJ1768215.1 hypothetical protein LPJ69_000155 [Coemansia sp. RSA 1752]KAJ1795241.1 hypothetical protein LPJ67_000148 [Coemansia sp. RSA 1938]KAJ2251433.1 hypothetical protein GGH98_003321 [Coemansia sp. RSA 454]KAJ2447689.1 hypothetical protein IWW46_000148 [Coemansia sp. RSA 2440]